MSWSSGLRANRSPRSSCSDAMGSRLLMSKLQLPIVVTPTRVELANRCHRRHFLSDILGKARYFSPSLEFGTVMHSAFAAHWMNQKAANPTDPFAVIDTQWA